MKETDFELVQSVAKAMQVSELRVRQVLDSQAGRVLAKRNQDLELKHLQMFFPKSKKLGRTPTVASFFSGCGGLDLGFKKSNKFRLAYANDLFGSAVLTYAKNIGEIDPRSIYDVPSDDVPEADVLLAGFPCQPFSNAGSRKGKADPRGTLFWETLRFIDSRDTLSRPKIVVFENVRGLLSMKNEDGSSLIEGIETELESRGYIVNKELINTANYGVPQNRHRVIIVGLRDDLWSEKFKFDLIPTKRGAAIGEALAKIPESAPNQVHWELSPQARDLIVHIPAGGSWKSIPDQYLPERLKKIKANMDRYHSPNFFRRFRFDEVMGTVTAAATPENSGILHPTENRRFTVREVATFQTFPYDFEFDGISLQSMYKQIGNAVPVEFGRRLALALSEKLNEIK